jgi:ribosomal protein S18 acetylase RimI-like enzyme
MSEFDLRRLEEAAMNAWPASQTVLIDGWVVRLSGGYTKRANSANPTYPCTAGSNAETVETCERLFARAGLPAIFRLTSFGAPAGVDDLLADRGYRHFDHSLVLTRPSQPLPALRAGLELRTAPVEEWLDRYVALSGTPLSRREAHLAILKRVSGEALFSLLWDTELDAPVACGLSVIEGDLVGIFDVMTDRERRRRGYGRALVCAMLNWSREHGAETAYLQVVAENAPAIALYEALGFREAYHYWYRVPEGV